MEAIESTVSNRAICPSPGNASEQKRASTATATILGMEAIKAVVSLDAPWYTSGAQKWKGNTASLKNMPHINISKPTSAAAFKPAVCERAVRMAGSICSR